MTFGWSGADGWVRLQATLDAMFAGVEDLLVDQVDPRAAAVLDVGCGTGATTLAIARRLGRGARCVGVDISEQMIALARRRAARRRGGVRRRRRGAARLRARRRST